MSHTQFTRYSRVTLATLLSSGKKKGECARILKMDRGSIRREIKLNKDADDIYRGLHAHQRAMERRRQGKAKTLKIENNRTLRRHIVRKLKLLWSPEQIAGRLKCITKKTIISHETIYTFIYKKRPDLIKYLRMQKSQYRRKRGTNARHISKRSMYIRDISERPVCVERRERVGDWEGDTIVGQEKTQRILTYVERRSGYGMAEKLYEVTAEIVHTETKNLFENIPKKAKYTLTRDNGPEFGSYDKTLERDTPLLVYRATPYHSWERGTNENWNGLMRQFFPKKSFFATVTKDQIQYAVRMLNNRPRKRLGYKTPREVFREWCNSD